MEEAPPPFFSKGFVGLCAGVALAVGVVVLVLVTRNPGAEIESFYHPRAQALSRLEAAHKSYSDKLDAYILRQTADPDAMDVDVAELSNLANALMAPFGSHSVPSDDACRSFQDAMRDYGLASVEVASTCQRVNTYIRKHNPAGREQAAVIRRMLAESMERLDRVAADLAVKRQSLLAAHPFLAPVFSAP